MKFSKFSLFLSLCAVAGASTIYAEEHMDLTQLEQVRTLQEADALYEEWLEEKEGGFLENAMEWLSGGDEPERDEGKEEDRYLAWRSSVINYIDENGVIDRSRGILSPAPPRVTPGPPGTQPNWTQIGPFGFDANQNTGHNPGVGRLQTLTSDPNNPNVLYAGAPIGGIWKSTNKGSTWTNLMINVPNHGISGIDVSSANSNIVVAVSGEGDGMGGPLGTGIYRSTDAGASWTNVMSYNANGKKIAFHPTNSNKVLAAISNGLYLSTDAGATWSSVSGTSNLSDADWHPGDEDVLYYSTNSTVTQYKISTGSKTTISGLPTRSHIRIETSPDAPDSLFILTAYDNKLAAFQIWDDVSNSITYTYNQSSGGKNILGYSENGDWSSQGFTWYAMGFEVSEDNANNVSAGSPLIWRSSNMGQSFSHGAYSWWDWTQPGYNHPDIHDLYYDGNTHYVISDGGIRYSTDGGTTYTDISTGISALASYQWAQSPIDGSYQITGLQDIGNFVRRGGQWYTTAGGDGYGGFVDVSDKDIFYFVQSGTKKSSYGDFKSGTKYTTVTNSSINYMDQSTSNPNYLVGAGSGGFYYSTDRGDSWTSSSGGGGTGKSVCFSPVDHNIVYGTSSGELYKSTNRGQTFSKLSGVSGYMNDVACDSQSKDVAWVVVSGTASQKVLKTLDGGSTWTNLTDASLSTESVREITHDGGNLGGIYIGTLTSVYYLDNNNLSWINWSAGFPWTQIQEMDVHEGDQKLRLASWGRGIWEADLYSGSGVGNSSSSDQSSSSSDQSSSSSDPTSSSSDVIVSSSSDVSSCYDLWQSSTSYNTGDQVTLEGNNYEACQWSKGKDPSVIAEVGPACGWDPNINASILWKDLGVCGAVSSSESSSSSEITVGIDQLSNIKIMANLQDRTLWIQGLEPSLLSRITIVNALGEMVLQSQHQSIEWTVDLNTLKQGQYFFNLSNGTEQISKRFVIQ